MSVGKLALAVAAVALFLSASTGWDTEAPPFDYTRVTKGGKYIFVMLLPKEDRQYAYDYTVYSDSSSSKQTHKRGLLHKIYPSSGLYRNDGSKKPLWTVDWYSFNVWPCSDGQHIVRWGPWARSRDRGQTLAIAFYHAGKKVRSYCVADLDADYEDFPHTVSHYFWAKQTSFDDAGKRVRIQLYKGYDHRDSGQTLMFDIPSGTFKTTGDKAV
jgi:hypothetical protein